MTSLRLGLAQLANTDATGVLVWPVDHPFARVVVRSYGARVLEVPVQEAGVRRDIDTKDDL